MELISKLLEKYRNLKPTDNVINDELIKIFQEELNVLVTRDEIRISRDVIYVTLSSVAKNVLSRRKEHILDVLFTKTRRRFTNII